MQLSIPAASIDRGRGSLCAQDLARSVMYVDTGVAFVHWFDLPSAAAGLVSSGGCGLALSVRGLPPLIKGGVVIHVIVPQTQLATVSSFSWSFLPKLQDFLIHSSIQAEHFPLFLVGFNTLEITSRISLFSLHTHICLSALTINGSASEKLAKGGAC